MNNSLQCVDNYKKTFLEQPLDVYCGYIGIINEYIIHHLDTIHNNEEKTISEDKIRCYLASGVQCITHVFKMLLLYTKNLTLTLYHSQRAFYFYVEFMEQLTDDMHTFLQLTPKDASLFVYKKTIYELNNEYRTSYNCDFSLSEQLIDNMITFYSFQIRTIIDYNNDHIAVLNIINNELNKIIQSINKYYHKQNDKNVVNQKIKELNIYMYANPVENNNYKNLEKFVKNFKK
jgi:hypothetical protein